MKPIVDKKVKMKLAGRDGNAFALLAAWRTEGRRQGWTAEELDAVCNEALNGSYDHLLQVLITHTED